jgi:NAD(P)-dependent dehydrogenase (short-subunit alcohol dehydrogenase family)
MGKLAGAVVVITGAASGIGRALALAAARDGARVHMVDRDAPGLATTARAIVAVSRARPPEVHALDLRDADAVETLAGALFEAEGRVDALVNNAGVMLAGPLESFALADLRWIVDTNLWTVIHGARAFAPRMAARGGGRIVNTASMAGLAAFPLFAAYSATKHGVVGLSQSLDAEFASRGVRVSAVCPGFVRTGAFQAARLRLPAGWRRAMGFGFEHLSASPEAVAARILEALAGRGGPVVPLPRETWPMYALRRLSPSLYARLLGRAFGPLARRAAAEARPPDDRR